MAKDFFLQQCDTALKVLSNVATGTNRPSPASGVAATALSTQQKKIAGQLMRINHCGEVCAQGLYQGQLVGASKPEIREHLQAAAKEEIDHLIWCKQRLNEVGAKPSVLNPLWYASSFVLGAVTSLISDRVSLGFVEATESQVISHLQHHQQILPPKDKRTHAIIEEMILEEERHGQQAIDAGGTRYPVAIKRIMAVLAKTMTATTKWI